ncbi:MAG: nucleotidyltransferase substrate binding protein [Bdellovibrionales bacterium]|nr:nucleotidyltransferase substrate binding protein [Bdellovibrionales bacterium]
MLIRQFNAFKNFQSALNKLEEFLSTPLVDDRDKAGVMHAFKYSFETCWNYIQKAVESHSKQVGSPKQAFKAAFELGWIKESEQEAWLKMIEDRNLT